ncbi:MAG TPA: FAD/NAD(P)-binding protein, partial [Kofleriaceae bacterium]|nr:FAD/NAD(P)-binding protein [Kofleriaceae bacterium]
MAPPPIVDPIVRRLADAGARALTAEQLTAALRAPGLEAGSFALPAAAHEILAQGSTWTLSIAVFPPGAATPLHVHRSPAAFRVLSGHALELGCGGPDRTWAAGEVCGLAPGALHQLTNPGTSATQGDQPLVVLHLSAGEPCRPDADTGGRGRIAIIGGGLSSAALAYHLAVRADAPRELAIIERGRGLGRGIAYGVSSPIFRLNVPASKMSLDPDRPDDFVRWTGGAGDPDAFLSRARYGSYVEARLADALAAGRVRATLHRDEAVRVDDRGVQLASGRRIDADQIVLATGLVPRRAPAWLLADPRVIDAWDEPALHALPPDGRLLIIGSGLSAIDVLGILDAGGFRGRVVVLSRHGLLPRPHLQPLRPAPPLDADILAAAPAELRGLVRWARRLVRDFEGRGLPWQLAIDALRPHVPRLWAALPPRDRARFVRSVRPYWEVLRHRAPRDALATVDEWQARGRLRVQAGRVTACRARPDGLEVDLAHADQRDRQRFDAIVR